MSVQQDHPHVNKGVQTIQEVMNATVMMDIDYMKMVKLVLVGNNFYSDNMLICMCAGMFNFVYIQ